MPNWQAILLGIIAVLFLVWMYPGIKQRMLHSPKATAEDWKGLMVPLILVVLFVLFLITLVRRGP